MKVILAKPRGFCAGVVRAIEIVERALDKYGPPVYVRHEIVHNKWVVDALKARGARFIEDLADVPRNAITIFSAHGVAKEVEIEAETRGLRVLNATCPLVSKVHSQGRHYLRNGRTVALIGHAGHPEVEGTLGQIPGKVWLVETEADVEASTLPSDTPIAYVTQTTLSVDDTREVIAALERRFPAIQGPSLEDICYATQNRQNAVKQLTESIDLLLVVGSPNSSNSNRLRELGERRGIPSYMIDSAAELDPAWFAGRGRIGLTAGASAPECLVDSVLARLRALGIADVREMAAAEESLVFNLPHELRPGNRVRA